MEKLSDQFDRYRVVTQLALVKNQTAQLKGSNIWPDEDFTKEVMEVRRQLISYLKQAGTDGTRAHVRYGKLTVGKQIRVYKLQELKNNQNYEEMSSNTNESLALVKNQTAQLKGSNIWPDEDFTKEVMEVRRQLISYLKQAGTDGTRAHVRYGKLTVGDGNLLIYGGVEETEWAKGGVASLILKDKNKTNKYVVEFNKLQAVKVEACAFVDDALVAINERDLEENMEFWTDELTKCNLTINLEKRKVMAIATKKSKDKY
ncbi:hypothetical protein ILUMI_02573 [Ignelater luminosus]|uniref:Uncharacterized protein n=1 Tax=Ignelater luminosus TaxID=2038154 RepID=A0A8K0GKQ7_IGNLU|nr:hypothetical protein ILUMI_02573 [Ignelater luminosus]